MLPSPAVRAVVAPQGYPSFVPPPDNDIPTTTTETARAAQALELKSPKGCAGGGVRCPNLTRHPWGPDIHGSRWEAPETVPRAQQASPVRELQCPIEQSHKQPQLERAEKYAQGVKRLPSNLYEGFSAVHQQAV